MGRELGILACGEGRGTDRGDVPGYVHGLHWHEVEVVICML